jgi:hypothetical protein
VKGFKIKVGPRWMLAMSLAAGALAVAGLLLVLPAGSSRADDPVINSAHVVVRFSDGDTAVRPITWTEPISWIGALQAAGFAVKESSGFICNIDGDGCPVSDCYSCETNSWGYARWDVSRWDEGAWADNPADGNILGFRNGIGDWGLTGKLPAGPTFVAASDALEWMREQQQADGSYTDAFGGIGASVRALVALGAAGYDPADWGSPNLLDFLTVISRTETADYAASKAEQAGKLALAAAWAGQDVADFAGINLPISITTHYSPMTGAYGAGSGGTVWAILGLHAMSETVPAEAVAFLKSVQNADGGWAWNEWGTSSETQHTATVVEALLAAGEDPQSAEIASALAFIESARNEDGGFAYMPPGDSDISSSAYVLQALLSAGQNPHGNWCSSVQGAYLQAVQQADGSYPGYSVLYSTQEVIPALMQRPFGPLAEWSYNCYGGYLPVTAK